jgi:hypothetical protein
MNRSIIAHDHVTAAIYTFAPKEFWVEAMEMSRPETSASAYRDVQVYVICTYHVDSLRYGNNLNFTV